MVKQRFAKKFVKDRPPFVRLYSAISLWYLSIWYPNVYYWYLESAARRLDEEEALAAL